MAPHVSEVVQCWSRLLTPTTEDDIKRTSSMKALTKGRETFLDYMKQGAFDNVAHSMMALIPFKKRVMDKVQPATIPSKYWCQLVGAEDEKDLLYIPE